MKKFSLLLLGAMLTAGCESGKENISQGLWLGSMTVQGREIAVTIDVSGDEVLFSIPIQGIHRVPGKQVKLTKESFSFRIPLPRGELRFQGSEEPGENNRLTGTYLQGTLTGEFFLEYKGTDTHPAPTEPRPGTDREVTLSRSGLTLYGRLRELPRNEDRGDWAALIIAGSGPTDGDGNTHLLGGKNNSLLRLANFLAEEGIPSLRFDKRSSGKSLMGELKEEDLSFSDMIDDAEAWYDLLRREYPGRNYILFGHSQGSLIALDIASRREAGGVVSLAGAGFPIKTTLEKQMKQYPQELREIGTKILKELSEGRRVKEVPEGLMGLFRPSVQPFFISYLKYNPAELIAEVTCPVLIVQGDMDGQVAPEEGENLYKAQPEAEYLFLPRMNHLLRDVENTLEDQRSYGEDRLPLSPGLKAGIRNFIKDLSK